MALADILRRRYSLNRNELRQAYRSVFSTGAGLAVLEDLCACLERIHPPGKDKAGMADKRAFHDGECSVALKILAMLGDKEAAT